MKGRLRVTKFLRVVTVALACGGLVACDEVPSQLRIGISSAVRGRGIEIHFMPCDSERVLSVGLLRAHGELVGDQDDEVLWEIQSEEGSQRSVYLVGMTAPGFELVSPLSVESLDPPPVAVKIQTTQIPSTTISFDPRELREGPILVRDGRRISTSDFRAQARQAWGAEES